MSGTNAPEPVGPHDPVHDAPRRQHQEPGRRSAAANDIRALRERRPATVGRKISPLAPLDSFDSLLENAVDASRPLDSDAMSESRVLSREIGRRGTFSGFADRLAAIGVSAIIALFFVIMLPAARQPNSTQLFAAAMRSFKTAFPRQHQGADAPAPALAGFQPLLASGDTAQAAERGQPEKASIRVLQQFMQWRQKANPSQPAR
jgi:hypothetical protein